jgi:putative PIN family toxin of toxin-antitoxin system
VVEAVRRGEIEPVLSWELVEEIADVLARPKLRRYEVPRDALTALLQLVAPALPTVEFDLELRDSDDAPVVAAALAGGAEMIVTGDRGLLDDEDLRSWLGERGIDLRTAAELLSELRSNRESGLAEPRRPRASPRRSRRRR